MMVGDAERARPAAAPRGKGRRSALTREQILAAAVAIIDAEGVEALTMRRLGQVLNRDPMAIYRHAPDKDALLDGVVDQVAAELLTPAGSDTDGDASRDGDWASELRRTAHTFRRVALAHPKVVPLLLTRPLSGPLALRPLGTLQLLEDLIELFSAAGFDEQGALHAARLFTGFLYGHVLHELQEQIQNPDETDDLLRLGLHRLPLTQFPRLRSLAAVLATYDSATELDEGLNIVIAGLRSQLRT
jgi:AcrR family transcriptional regulator